MVHTSLDDMEFKQLTLWMRWSNIMTAQEHAWDVEKAVES